MSTIPWLAVATAGTAIPTAALFVVVWRERTEPGAHPYALLLLLMVSFVIVYSLSLVAGDRPLHLLLYSTSAWFKVLTTIPWLLFALEYTGRGRYATRRLTAALLVLPVASLLVLFTSLREPLLVQGYEIQVVAGVVTSTFEPGPLWLVLIAFSVLVNGSGVVMLLEFAISDRQRYGFQTTLLMTVSLLPWVTTVAHTVGLGPLSSVDFSPLAYAAVAPPVAYAVHRWDLFGFAPATRRIGQAAVIDDFGDAMLITDGDGRLVDLNSRAADLLAATESRVAQEPVATVLDAPLDLESPQQTVRLDTHKGRRDFDLAVSDIEGPRRGTIGYTLVLHDVTDEKQRRQRFEVLNRILRHNLRNSMNAVAGYSRELDAHVDESGEWMVDRIEAQSARLVALGEKAREIDRVTDPDSPATQVPITESLGRVRDRLRDDDANLTVTVHTPGGLAVTSNETVFEEVVYYAASSLLSYNGTDSPRIVMSATPTDGARPWIEVTVTSNGAPVPADERDVIERGEETPLDHSHDLDLWLVSWGVDTLGGDLRFREDADRPGLSLSIPDQRAMDHAPPSG